MASVNPAPDNILVQTLVSCLQNGQLQHAEELCKSICAAYPKHADTLQLMAIIYARTGRYALANDFFLQAIANAPERADFYGNYGNVLLEQGRTDDAADACQQALVLGSARPEVYNTLGNALATRNRIDAAVDCYRKAIALQADYHEAYNNLGQALKTKNDFRGAEECFRQALALRPDFDAAAANLAEVDTAWLEPIYGKRLYLRRFDANDADFIYRCYQDANFMRLYNRFAPKFSREALTVKLQEEQQKHPCQIKTVNWIMAERKTLRPIGIANLVDIQIPHSRAEFLIGIPNSSDRAGGSPVEATLLVLDFAFNRVNLNKLIAFVYGDNFAAQKNALAGGGFKQESFQRQHLRHPETKDFIDLYGNSILQDDFRKNACVAKLSQRLLGRNITLNPFL